MCRFVRSGLAANHCAKLYAPSSRSVQLQRKVEYMSLNPPGTLTGPTYSLAWPTHTLFTRNGAFAGFAMPQAPLGAVQLYEVSTLKLSRKLPSTWKKFDRAGTESLTIRAKVCANIAIAIHQIHESGKYCLGDMKPQNILLSPDGRTCVVDLDSLQISHNGQVLFPAHLVTPEYSPPEARTHRHGQVLPVQWDLFSLAVCLYEVLVGVHPYAASARAQGIAAETLQGKIAQHLFVHGSNASLLSSIPAPHALFKSLPAPVQQLFQEAFAIPVRSIARPTAERWFEVLSRCIASNSFRPIGPPIQPTPTGKPPGGNPRVQPPGPIPPTPPPTPVPYPWLRIMQFGLAGVAVILLILFFTGRSNEESPQVPANTVTDRRTPRTPTDSGTEVNPVQSTAPVPPMVVVPEQQPTQAATSTVYDAIPTSPPNGGPAPPRNVVIYYLDKNGDGVGGTESVEVPTGKQPPPYYVAARGDDRDGEKLQLRFLQKPEFFKPSNCPLSEPTQVRIQVLSPNGSPVPDCTVTLGMDTPSAWISSPKLAVESTGVSSVRTGSDGTVTLRFEPPESFAGKPAVKLAFGVRGASAKISATLKATVPLCPTCTPCVQ